MCIYVIIRDKKLFPVRNRLETGWKNSRYKLKQSNFSTPLLEEMEIRIIRSSKCLLYHSLSGNLPNNPQ